MIESLNRRIATVWIATVVALSILLLPVYSNSATSAVHHSGIHLSGGVDATPDEHANTGKSGTGSDCEKNGSDSSENAGSACCDIGCPTMEVFASVNVSTGFIPPDSYEHSSAGALVARHSFDLMRPPRN